ncbi:HNRNPU isoform 3 [Pan troglodytes]|uniref:HNRNPU isoform 3 n=1 Tax=Pan troglodytes TaxID=9598 RepID=A0A2J8KNI4_PANTR|nr:HNRNPU isoform 3 [Pan troglodytes]
MKEAVHWRFQVVMEGFQFMQTSVKMSFVIGEDIGNFTSQDRVSLLFRIIQLLLLPLCFLSGSRWVPSYNIFFLISSLAILSWILCFA